MSLIFGDCLEEMPRLADASINMVLTDPPYGTTRCRWDSVIPLEPMWEQLKRLIKPNGIIAMTARQPFTTSLISSNKEMFKYCWVWNKITKPSGFLNAKKRPLVIVEDIVIFYMSQPTYNPQMVKGDKHKATASTKKTESYNSHKHEASHESEYRYPKDLISISRGYVPRKGNNHPVQKPVELMEYLIKTYTNEGDTVLDFAMGSGTTGVACKNFNRKFIGIELDRKYFDIAKGRI